MYGGPSGSTRTDTLVPYAHLCRSVGWADGDRPVQGGARRGGSEGLRLDDPAPAHGQSGGTRSRGGLPRLAGQQLHDRQRSRRRRRAGATLTLTSKRDRTNIMNYAIIGFGEIGQTLARAFARRGIDISVATTRDPESIASAAAAIGPGITPTTLAEGGKADIIFLAVRLQSPPDVAKSLPSWAGTIIVDGHKKYRRF